MRNRPNVIALNSATKLSDPLSAYPWPKEVLAEIHENFKLSNTPLGSVLACKATIVEMRRRSGMEESLLIERLTALIVQH